VELDYDGTTWSLVAAVEVEIETRVECLGGDSFWSPLMRRRRDRKLILEDILECTVALF
jgi:hypothetical protein